MHKLEQQLTRSLEIVLALLLFAIAAIVVTLVVLRYVFNSSITGANEWVTILFVYTTSIGAAVAIGRREHIAIGFAVEALPPAAQRLAELVEIMLVAVLNSVILYGSISWIRITGDYLMPSTRLPRLVVQVSVPIGCGLAILYCLVRLFRLTAAMRDGKSI